MLTVLRPEPGRGDAGPGRLGWAGRDWAGSPGREQRGAAPSELGSVYTLI